MHIKGEHLGVDAQARQVTNQKAEKAAKSRNVKREGSDQVAGKDGAPSDAIQISKQARDLQTQALGRQLETPQDQEDVQDMRVAHPLPADLQRIQAKLEQGFYESQEVLAKVTERLLEDFGFPAPDSQDLSPED